MRPVQIACIAALSLAAAMADAGARAEGGGIDELVIQTKKAMMADPRMALARARTVYDVAMREPVSPARDHDVATALWLEGEALTRTNKVAEAHAALTRAMALAERSRTITRLNGDLSLSMARLAESEADFSTALKSYQKAHDIFARLGIARYQSIALQGLGSIYDKAHDFDHEIQYYRRASQVYSEDPALELSAANNIGYALQQLGRFSDAETYLRRALAVAKTMNSAFLQSEILTNLAHVYAKEHLFAEAEKAANQAGRLLGQGDDSGSAPFVWGVKAEIEYERGRIDLAAADLARAFHGIDLTTTIFPFRDIHEIAVKVYRAKGEWPLALAHFEAFKRLDDQGRSLAASANLALMNAQFDFANQQLEIEQLKSAQLERDMSLRESRAAMQRLIFAAVLLAGFLFILWIGWRHHLVRRHRNAIRRANIELTRTLGERDMEIGRRIETEAQLRLAMEAAKQASLSKTHFLANMSHELRTPLNAIIGFSEILAGEIFGPIGNANYKGYAADITAGGRHLLEILTDILDMARLEAGSETIADEELSLDRVVDDALASVDTAILDRKTLRFVRPGGQIRMHGDERRLRQIVTHLVSNAIKFTGHDGHVEVRIERAPDGGADLLVSDDGAGIAAEKLAMVLEPFGQAEGAYARAHGGVGLGLPIVKSLAALHGGWFRLESTVGHGTTARVHFPKERLLDAAALAAASAA